MQLTQLRGSFAQLQARINQIAPVRNHPEGSGSISPKTTSMVRTDTPYPESPDISPALDHHGQAEVVKGNCVQSSASAYQRIAPRGKRENSA